jgi:pimeloyl-ACP methyl ester carboxylesterase
MAAAASLRLAAPVLDLGDRVFERRRRARWRARGGDRGVAPFARDEVMAAYARRAHIEGRDYTYVLYPGTDATLGIHFSAFFGEWGERRENRPQFQGHFHRMRMFWPLQEHSFLFLCDTFGADRNGTYYKGEDNDFFVERAMEQIIESVQDELAVPARSTVAMGSSMGATAAIRFALRHGYAGAIGVSPHLDLDLAARFQGRRRHVAAIVGREDVEAEELFGITREIRALAAEVPATPRVVLQSMRDDDGVHTEQVLPFVAQWRDRGGTVDLDERPTGGHTSEYATAEWFADRIAWCLQATPAHVG